MRRTLLFLLLVVFSNINGQILEWKTSLTDAIEISNKTRKPMLILFTANNMDGDLQAEVFKTYDFNDWYKKNVVLVRLDLSDSSLLPEVKDSNLKIKNAFGVQDLPVVCYAKANIRNNRTTFQLLGKVAYDRSGVKNWIRKSNDAINEVE
ncbi:thioredoxin family protein [Flavobacterium sp. TMP13]|uniref:thioredoxin family protein n=1 Tax=Flavobacterium sp. TMP13 TaxID=3425950 RepID=UPI003D789A53